MSLAHAQLTVAGLLEGDAAFFWAPGGGAGFIVGQRLPQMHRSFLAKRDTLALDRACDCASCSQLEGLSLKFVANQGEVAEQRVRDPGRGFRNEARADGEQRFSR